jgi:hypothetical protein
MLMQAAPDLSYMSVWTNDSGAGFEHTSSLYVGRNGGPYMIREWRNHDKIAQAAGESIVRYLNNLQTAAAEMNPDFDVILRLEPFKVEQDHIKAGMGPHVTWEALRSPSAATTSPTPSEIPGERQAVAGSIFHTTMDRRSDAGAQGRFAQARRRARPPLLRGSSVMNHEPLLGLPFPRSMHQKLSAVREVGITRVSALGGLTNTAAPPTGPIPSPYAPHSSPEKPIETVLTAAAALASVRLKPPTSRERGKSSRTLSAGSRSWCSSAASVSAGSAPGTARSCPTSRRSPPPSAPTTSATAASSTTTPASIDLGKDVLFDLITQQSGAKMAADMDQHVIARLRPLIAKLGQTAQASTGQAAVVFTDLRDRIRAYLHWVSSLRSVCAWCENVYGYLDAKDAATKATFEKNLQGAIDFELANIRGLIGLLETTKSEVLVLSGVAENTYFYGENLVEHLKTKIRLTEQYRHHAPRLDPDIFWRPIPGTTWPAGWDASTK